jgi:enamine deaminase RidA (YjgF/YER057c/UK114 family)
MMISRAATTTAKSLLRTSTSLRSGGGGTNHHVNVAARRFVHIEQRLEELGIELPTPSSPKANYNIMCHASGNMMYISGHLPFKVDGTLITGRIGDDDGCDKDHGYEAARACGVNLVATLKSQLGDLDRVEQVVKVNKKWPTTTKGKRKRQQQQPPVPCIVYCAHAYTCFFTPFSLYSFATLLKNTQIFGIVQSADDFKEQHLVMDGCSDLIMEVFGKEVGYHARSAIGTNTLPLNMSVEVEAIVQIKPE